MTDVAHDGNGNGRATLREVYTLVEATRSELTTSVNQLAAEFRAFAAPVADRLTVVEQQVKFQGEQLASDARRLDTHGHDIGLLKDTQRSDEVATAALQGARTKRVAWRQWAIGTALFATAAVPGLVALVHR